jgi:hypothetical protein
MSTTTNPDSDRHRAATTRSSGSAVQSLAGGNRCVRLRPCASSPGARIVIRTLEPPLPPGTPVHQMVGSMVLCLPLGVRRAERATDAARSLCWTAKASARTKARDGHTCHPEVQDCGITHLRWWAGLAGPCSRVCFAAWSRPASKLAGPRRSPGCACLQGPAGSAPPAVRDYPPTLRRRALHSSSPAATGRRLPDQADSQAIKAPPPNSPSHRRLSAAQRGLERPLNYVYLSACAPAGGAPFRLSTARPTGRASNPALFRPHAASLPACPPRGRVPRRGAPFRVGVHQSPSSHGTACIQPGSPRTHRACITGLGRTPASLPACPPRGRVPRRGAPFRVAAYQSPTSRTRSLCPEGVRASHPSSNLATPRPRGPGCGDYWAPLAPRPARPRPRSRAWIKQTTQGRGAGLISSPYTQDRSRSRFRNGGVKET